MNWWDVLIAFGIIAAFLIYRRSGLVSVKDAQEHLKHGALVIDVRTAGEFVSGHLPVAVNLPLSEVESNWNRRIKDKIKCCYSTARAACAAAQQKRNSSRSAARILTTWEDTDAPRASSAASKDSC